MTAVRAAARLALGAIVLASMLWTGFGPQGLWTLAWLVVMCIVVWGAVETWERTGNRRGRSTR